MFARLFGSSSKKSAAPSPFETDTPTQTPTPQATFDPNSLDKLKQPKKELLKSSQPDKEFLELGLIMDCTGSMSSWITRAKETLQQIIETIEHSAKEGEDGNPVTVRIAFIGYRDIKTTAGRFVIKPFTEDVQSMKSYIDSVRADGGEDAPEDVQGGLKMMLMEDWTEEASKKVFMIADAPPHGTHLHAYGSSSDHYPEGSPDGLIFEDLMKEFKEKNIDFNVIKLDKSCDTMIKVMMECNDEVDVKDMSHQVQEERQRSYAKKSAAPRKMSKAEKSSRGYSGMAMMSASRSSMKECMMEDCLDMMEEADECCEEVGMAMAAPVDLKAEMACYMAESSVATLAKNRAARKEKEEEDEMLARLMAL